MSEPQNDAACVKALLDYSQADEDGVFVFVSRQAIHETASLVEEQVKTIRQLRTELATARETAWDEALNAVVVRIISGMPQIFAEYYSDKIRALKPQEPKL